MRPSTLLTPILLICLFSCQKHNSPPVTPAITDTTTTKPSQPVDSILSLNLYYPDATGIMGSTYELIVSEAGGAILLDSIAQFNTPVITKLKTKQPSVDVMTVVYSAAYSFYSVYIYKAVRPATWVDALPGTQQNPPPPIPSAAKIFYTDTPPVGITDVLFNTGYGSGAGLIEYDYTTPKQLDISYQKIQGSNYAYLLLPTLGLYNWHPIGSASDTVDLTHMDTAVLVHYSKPSQYSFHNSYIFGYPDSTDLGMYFPLFFGDSAYQPGDGEYPPKKKVPMQKYVCNIQATTTNKELAQYQTYADSVPTVLPYPASPVYTLHSKQSNNFSVSFTQKPMLYTTGWQAGNISILISAPPDSVNLRPLDLLNSLKSKMLAAQSLSSLTLTNFGYYVVPGVDYNDYFVHQCDPVKVTTQPFAAILYYDIAE